MINNYWEELNPANINKNINDIHQKVLSEMGLPSWLSLDCPFCHKPQPITSIREFGLKLNPRNIGDIFVQICCYDCKKMDTLYFRSEVNRLDELIEILSGTRPLTSEPLIEEEMYKKMYNNLIEKAIASINAANAAKGKI